MTIHATVSNQKATVTSQDAGNVKPTSVIHSAQGGTDSIAAIKLCRRLVAEGWDPGARIDIPPLTIKYLGQAI